MGLDVWPNSAEWIETLLGWEEGEGVRGSVRPWLGSRLLAYYICGVSGQSHHRMV